jgi:hypothetical protein
MLMSARQDFPNLLFDESEIAISYCPHKLHVAWKSRRGVPDRRNANPTFEQHTTQRI